MERYYNSGYTKDEIINGLISKNNFKKYLEIGVNNGDNFYKINCPHKISVDPVQNGATTHVMTSDKFFEDERFQTTFDLIFIDGLHVADQCYRDMVNSINHLNDNGFIICHDMNPVTKIMTRPLSEFHDDGIPWTGDVYKAFVKFRQNYTQFNSCLLYDCDYGLGVIMKTPTSVSVNIECDADNLTFEEFSFNKNYLMNCVPTQEFVKNFIL